MIYVYGKEGCLFCKKAVDLLRSEGHAYTYCDIYGSEDTMKEMIGRVTQVSGLPPKTVPQIFFDNELVGGYHDLVEYLHPCEDLGDFNFEDM